MNALKWDFKEERYELWNVPEDWKVSCYEKEMSTRINCANCGADVSFGECYTSQRYHTPGGFGYSVCEKCHEEEVEENRRNWRSKKDG